MITTFQASENGARNPDQAAILINSIKDYAIFMLDRTGHVASWNEGARRLKQYEANEIIGKSFSTFYTPEDLSNNKPAYELEVATAVGRYEDEGWRVRKDGSYFWANVIITAIRDADANLIGFSKVTRDLTERKNAEDALKAANDSLERRVSERTLQLTQSESQFRTLADAIPHLVCIAQADGSISWFNNRWFDYTGLTSAELKGWGWKSVHDPAMLAEVLERWMASLKSGLQFEMEFPLRGADGLYRWFLTRVIPVQSIQGEVICWFGTNTDIDDKRKTTELQRNINAELEKRVLERTAELEFANKELESFSYSVSHDLRTPLRAISGFCNRLLKTNLAQLDEEGKDSLGRVVAAAQRMGRLIDDLLSLARVSRAPISIQYIDLSEMAESVNTELARLEPERRVTVKIEHPAAMILGDPGLMRVVLQNLFSNARKYTSKTAEPTIEFGQKKQKERLVYYVRDNGVGFDMRYANKLFGAFQRLHSNAEFEGTGIGLATVKRIMQRHKGEVWAEATPNQGATFFFSFDLSETSAKESAKKSGGQDASSDDPIS